MMYENIKDWGFVKAPCDCVVDQTDHYEEYKCPYKSDCICWRNFTSDLGDTLPDEVKL